MTGVGDLAAGDGFDVSEGVAEYPHPAAETNAKIPIVSVASSLDPLERSAISPLTSPILSHLMATTPNSLIDRLSLVVQKYGHLPHRKAG